jgi:hypothetical protein
MLLDFSLVILNKIKALTLNYPYSSYIIIILALLIKCTTGITASGSIHCRMRSLRYSGNILYFIKFSINFGVFTSASLSIKIFTNIFWGVKLTTHLQLVLGPRKCGSIQPLSYTPSWHSAKAEGQLYLLPLSYAAFMLRKTTPTICCQRHLLCQDTSVPVYPCRMYFIGIQTLGQVALYGVLDTILVYGSLLFQECSVSREPVR